MTEEFRIAILGAGNIGTSIAKGLVQSGHFAPARITLTRRRVHLLEDFKAQGFDVSNDNISAVNASDVVIVSVEPQLVDGVLEQIAPALDFVDLHPELAVEGLGAGVGAVVVAVVLVAAGQEAIVAAAAFGHIYE